MKKLILSIILVSASIVLFAQEGMVINMKLTNTKGASGSFVMYVSQSNARVEMNMKMPPGTHAPDMKLIAIMKASEPTKTYMLSDENKSYTVHTTETKSENNYKKSTIKVVKIGEETIIGYKCIHSKVTDDGEESDVWTSKDVIPNFEKYSNMFTVQRLSDKSTEQLEAMKAAACDGFPVKTVVTNKMEGTTTMELVKIEKKPLDKSLFEIPAGYKEGNMAKTMMGIDFDMDKIMQMPEAEREIYLKKMEEEIKKKYGEGEE